MWRGILILIVLVTFFGMSGLLVLALVRKK